MIEKAHHLCCCDSYFYFLLFVCTILSGSPSVRSIEPVICKFRPLTKVENIHAFRSCNVDVDGITKNDKTVNMKGSQNGKGKGNDIISKNDNIQNSNNSDKNVDDVTVSQKNLVDKLIITVFTVFTIFVKI